MHTSYDTCPNSLAMLTYRQTLSVYTVGLLRAITPLKHQNLDPHPVQLIPARDEGQYGLFLSVVTVFELFEF